ncbi:hypothetical protein KZ483_23675 [Paenibacillus sp. sptzw28]|uniref:hypothetical protein n=1 Tax=Paenibacillus sp. sptzw28 TaxID=715179 RepID=UPI001C6E52C6|nr:hypothetical protein [Paenibacillus sp. sptzw28]QYR20729.1 hypothetical protein KZ483_23675 [Paenibacillus sp. sptzw28]
MKNNDSFISEGKRIQATDDNRWMSLLPNVGCALMVLGLVLSLCFAYEFKDSNLGLMVGIGFIIGGTQVLVLGTMFRVVPTRQIVKVSPATQSDQQ